ncbi:ATP-binding cassette domain-containing protein [Akkermansiaceae bacterium]|nr:ATP-binding cassette domain-containing protein [Akkermansiaceae bacterium]
MSALEVRDVTHRFGSTPALAGVELSISPGEQVALIGASGSGKTTLLRLLGLQTAPSSGGVSTLGCDLKSAKGEALRATRARIGMLPQDLGLVPNLRVIQNVIMGRSGTRHLLGTIRDLLWPRKSDREEIFQILQRMGVAPKMYDRTDSLSGGQQQRVALSRTLYQGAEILLADEPLSAVDPARARDVLELLTGLSTEQGFTLVVSLHQVELAREFFPRVVGLKDGKVVFDGKPTDEELSSLYHL